MYSSLLNSIGLLGTEDKFYSLLLAHGPFERRLYQRCVLAKIITARRDDLNFYEQVKSLNEYINGNNFKAERFFAPGPMTLDWKEQHCEVSIVLPFNQITSHIPEPVNRAIRLEECSPKQFVNIRYRGDLSHEILQDKKEQLKKWINYKGLQPLGEGRVLINTPDAVLDFFKTFDIQIEVR